VRTSPRWRPRSATTSRPAPPAAISAARRRGSYSAAFDDAIWTQEIGAVGQPVRSEFGYHLVVVSERGTLTFEEMRDDLKAAVEAQSTQALQSWLTEAARNAQVTVDAGAGTWDAANGLVKAVGAIDAPELDLAPEDPNNPSDDLKPTPSSTTTLAVPTTASEP
jgi:foldase protein PrsA